MIGYLNLARDSGKRAWIRVDEISAFAENETKVDGQLVPCITILLRNNVSWHFPSLTGARLVEMMRSANGQQVNILTEDSAGL